MVTITNFRLHETKEGKPFVSLELSGDVEMVQSSQTGRFYATSKRCWISCTFSEDIAKSLVGKQIKGRIERVQCESYQYTVPETGELITLSHTYMYQPDEAPVVALPQSAEGGMHLLRA